MVYGGMYADDEVLIGQSMKEAMRAYKEWEKALEHKGLKIYFGKTKGIRVSKELDVKD